MTTTLVRHADRRRQQKPTGPLSTMTQFTPPEWPAVINWIRHWKAHELSPPGLFIDDDDAPVITRLLAKARRTRQKDNLSIRVNRDEAAALYYQFLFWESAQDELRAEVRADMPAPPVFASMMGEAEGDCLTLGLRPDGTTAW